MNIPLPLSRGEGCRMTPAATYMQAPRRYRIEVCRSLFTLLPNTIFSPSLRF